LQNVLYVTSQFFLIVHSANNFVVYDYDETFFNYTSMYELSLYSMFFLCKSYIDDIYTVHYIK